MTTGSRGTTSAANKQPVSPARADCYDRQCRYKPSVPERRGGPERCHLRPAPLDNRLTLGASADKKVAVRAIAERRSARVLALAEVHRLRFFCRPGHRRDGRALMRAIAEWLICRLAAGAPIVSLARFHLDWLWPLFGHDRLSAQPWSPCRRSRYDPRRFARLLPRLSARAAALLTRAGAHDHRCSGLPGRAGGSSPTKRRSPNPRSTTDRQRE